MFFTQWPGFAGSELSLWDSGPEEERVGYEFSASYNVYLDTPARPSLESAVTSDV